MKGSATAKAKTRRSPKDSRWPIAAPLYAGFHSHNQRFGSERKARRRFRAGCCGARAYVNALTDDFAIWALPGAKIAEYAARIKVLTAANALLLQFHKLRRIDVEHGESPSVKESLARLQGAAH